MATRKSRTITTAPLLIVAGAALLIAFATSATGSFTQNWWIYAISELAIAGALFLLGRGSSDQGTRVSLFLAAAGWAVIVLTSLTTFLGIIGSLASSVAAIAGIIAGILVWQRHGLSQRASQWFFASMIVGAVYLLGIGANLFPNFNVIAVAFGVCLLVSGVFARARR
jgi:cytochrome bd-type quinol oxidase subunit 2